MTRVFMKKFCTVAFALCALPFAAVATEQLDYWSLNTNAFDFVRGAVRGGYINDGVFQIYAEVTTPAGQPTQLKTYGMYLDGMTVPEGLKTLDFSKPVKDALTGEETGLKITAIASATDKYRYSAVVTYPTEWLAVIGKIVLGAPELDRTMPVSVTGFTSLPNLGEIECRGWSAFDGSNDIFSNVAVTNIIGSSLITAVGYQCLRNNKGKIPGILDLTGATSLSWLSLGGVSAVRVSDRLTEVKGGLENKELYGFVPSVLRTVGGKPFAGVKFMDLPDGVLELPPEITSYPYHSGSDCGSFQFCRGVRELILPETLTDIPRQMFHGCVDLEKVTIKAKQLTSLGQNAFTCDKLHDIWYLGAPPPAADISPLYFERKSYKKGGTGVAGYYAFTDNQVTNHVPSDVGWEALSDTKTIPGPWTLSGSTVQRFRYSFKGLLLIFK